MQQQLIEALQQTIKAQSELISNLRAEIERLNKPQNTIVNTPNYPYTFTQPPGPYISITPSLTPPHIVICDSNRATGTSYVVKNCSGAII